MKNNARPFLKWVGGKSQLLKEIQQYYPFDFPFGERITKYAEPFVGGGAVLFDVLNKFDLEAVYISDVNERLITTYKMIRDNVDDIIELTSQYQKEYIIRETSAQQTYFNAMRDLFNHETDPTQIAALMIFLNKTCFNGLYRENKDGKFNSPCGRYKKPTICDKENLRTVSEKLQKVEIVLGDYSKCEDFVDEHTFVYFDPPYRPISDTAAFTAYNKNGFDDNAQIELAHFIDGLNEKGAKILMSNSDPKNKDEGDNFFDDLFSVYNIKRVYADRAINCKGDGRGKVTELLISNF